MKFEDIRKYVKAVLTNSFTNKKTIDKLSESEDGNTLLFNGEEIKSGGSKQLTELEDVHLTNLTNKNILQYNQTSQKWINTPITNNIIKFPNTPPRTKTITPVPKDNTVTTLMTFENDCWASVRVRFSSNQGNLVYGIKNEKNQIMFRHRFWAYQHIYSALLYSPPFPVKKGWSIYISNNFHISSISVEYNECETTESLNIAENIEKWDSTTQYPIGSYCIYNNILWKCKKNNANQIPEESIYWTNAALTENNQLHYYSTEEQVVGTWIDGKPIYERVIHVENFIIGDNEIPLENLDIIINYSGNLILTEFAENKRVFPYFQNDNSNKVVIRYYNNTKFVVASTFNCNNIYIIIQYTKTTDY